MREEAAGIKGNLVQLGERQEGEHCVGAGLWRKAGSGSWKQSPTSPEMCGGASTHTASILTLHPIYRFQLDLGIAFCFFQGQKFRVSSFAGC